MYQIKTFGQGRQTMSEFDDTINNWIKANSEPVAEGSIDKIIEIRWFDQNGVFFKQLLYTTR